MKRLIQLFAGLCCAGVLMLVLPRGLAAGLLLVQQERAESASEAAMLADPKKVSADALARGAEEALDAGDPDLANSFVALAETRGVELALPLRRRVAEAVAAEADLPARAARFAEGFATGRVNDATSLAGTVAGDLTAFGDVRDLAREGWHYTSGAEVDSTMVALAGAGLALTAGTYATLGTTGVARLGLSAIKGIRRGARSTELTVGWLGKTLARTDTTRDGARVAFGLARDAGRVNAKLGSRGALDALKVSRSPQDLARVVRLAEKRGIETRALLKLFGRGAIVLGGLALDLAGWVLWLALALYGALSWIKASTERLTRTLIRRRGRARPRHVVTVAAAG